MEQKEVTNNISPKENYEKDFSLNNFYSKLNKKETVTFGNYVVNFKEMFKKEEDYKDYFKKHVSLFNDDPINKEKKIGTVNSFLQPKFFDNFDEKTLFYIFYYMPRDSLQLFAGVHLYKKGWVYNYKYQIWFKKIKDSDKWEFFNPLEWKKNEYIFDKIEEQYFLSEEEAKSYSKQFDNECKKENKKKQGKKENNINTNTNSAQTNNADN